METKHTKEPWETSVLSDGTEWIMCGEGGGDACHSEHDIKRAIACVNACHGIQNPEAIADCIAALERIIRGHDMSGYTCPTLHGEDAEDPTLLDEARAALAKLKGGES